MNLPNWATKIQAIWVALGSFLILLVAQGVDIPEILPKVLSQDTWNAIIQAVSSVVVFYQYIRGLFASKSDGQVQVASTGAKIAYLINPFRLNVA